MAAIVMLLIIYSPDMHNHLYAVITKHSRVIVSLRKVGHNLIYLRNETVSGDIIETKIVYDKSREYLLKLDDIFHSVISSLSFSLSICELYIRLTQLLHY